MPDHIYTYVGFDLAKPLRLLIDKLREDIARGEQELSTMGEKPPQAMLRPATVADVKRDRLSLSIEQAQKSLYRAALWVHECERMPDAIYSLDTTELEWLYRFRQAQILGLCAPTAQPVA